MDNDLETLSREQLIEEAKKLRNGIRRHRDSTQHALCWHHPALWDLLPEKSDPLPVVPDWPQFLQPWCPSPRSFRPHPPPAKKRCSIAPSAAPARRSP
ncbi:MAG: hypothetical protein LLH30_04230 [Candidatus Manganitrophus sp. SA1]|nr:hypothetical protein [Candidatus Manganitrophus morganii]